MTKQLPEIPVRFYRTAPGKEPVLDWLRSLDKEDRHKIGIDLMRVQLRLAYWNAAGSQSRAGLWEVRPDLPSGRTARLLLCFHESMLIVLHGFIKKTQKTPESDLELSRRCMKEIAK